MNEAASWAKSIRLVFELARADNPRLFDELIRFTRGQKRVNRLRVLAYDGLLVQQGLLPYATPASGTPRPFDQVARPASTLTDQLFEPGLKE